jgi:hypothetical protein
MGLGPAALWAGASTAVVSSWALLDHPFTDVFDHAVITALCTSPRPAWALRELQLDALQRWRESTPTAPGEMPPTAATEPAPPLLWAPYLVLGRAAVPSRSRKAPVGGRLERLLHGGRRRDRDADMSGAARSAGGN